MAKGAGTKAGGAKGGRANGKGAARGNGVGEAFDAPRSYAEGKSMGPIDPEDDGDDDFDQGGADGPRRLQAANDPGARGEGHNSRSYDGEALAQAIETIRAEEEAIKAKMDAASKACEAHRNTIKVTKKALVESGFPSEVLAVLLRKDKLQRKIERIDENLDDEQKDQFQSMEEALGDFLDSPLGQAAVNAEAGRVAAH
ncbi:MAG: hypothetical protein ACRCU1_05165 [Alsobacter sp.]